MALADWDARLLSPERALQLAGDWPVYATHELAELQEFGDQPSRWQINLRCRKDGQSCGLLAAGHEMLSLGEDAYETTIGDLLSGVVRHMVTAHDLSLSGAEQAQFCLSCRAVLVAGHETDPSYHEQTCEIIHG